METEYVFISFSAVQLYDIYIFIFKIIYITSSISTTSPGIFTQRKYGLSFFVNKQMLCQQGKHLRVEKRNFEFIVGTHFDSTVIIASSQSNF